MYEDETIYEKEIALRIAKLRTQKNVSARDMSLSVGQNTAYISNIENGNTMPSMRTFFYICQYLMSHHRNFLNLKTKIPADRTKLFPV